MPNFPFAELFVPSKKKKKELYGARPEYDTPEQSAATAIAANLANLPKAEELGAKVNSFNQAQIMEMMRKAIPGFDLNAKLSSDLLTSGLRGEVSEAVRKQTNLFAASKAQAGGFAGSGAMRNLELRDFAGDSFEATQRAIDSNTRWTESMARLTQPALFNVGSAFVPFEAQQAHDKLVADVKAAPDPGVRGQFDSKMAMFGMMTGVYGGAGYQNSASGGQAPTQYYPQNSGANSIPGGSYYDGSKAWGGTYGETAGAGAFNF